MAALIKQFNASEYSKLERYPKQGQKSSGKADHFFCNGYFRIQQLKDMALNLLPLPVPLKRDLQHQAAAGRCAADFGGNAGGHGGGSPASPAPASTGGNTRRRRRPASRSSFGPASSSGGGTADSDAERERERETGGGAKGDCEEGPRKALSDPRGSSGVDQRRLRRPRRAEIDRMRRSLHDESDCSDVQTEKRMWEAAKKDPAC